MKNIFSKILILCLIGARAIAQDPAIGSAGFSVSPVAAGSTTVLNITLQNLSTIPVPVQSLVTGNQSDNLYITISTGSTYYTPSPVGAAAVSGPGSLYFTWTVQPDGYTLKGTLILPLPPLLSGELGRISVNIIGVASSNSVPIFTGILVQDPYGLADVNSNNNGKSPSLIVTGAVLPVDFLNVSAAIKSCQAQVDWKVANQVNLKQYELESSTDGINFNAGKIVPLNNQNAYSAELPVYGDSIYFYRVKAVDLDGKYKYSAIASVKANCTGRQGAFLMYPNPVMKGNQVIVSSTTNESTMYRVLDMAGKTMQEGRFTGNTTLQINTGGTYIVDLQSASASTKYKLVVQ